VRRFLLALACAVLLLGMGLALAAVNVDAWVNANRDAIAKRASFELGREVSFGEVGVSLRSGFGVRVADLTVAGDPAFSKDAFLRAAALELRVRILPALRARIEVDQVVLRSPEITVIRTEQGLSTASLGRGPGTAAAAQKPAEPSAPGALLVAFVDIEDGTLRFVDRRPRPPVETLATQLDFRASELAPGAPVSFEMQAAVLGAARQNLRATGRVDAADEPSADVAIEIAPLDLAKALASAPLAGSLPEGLVARAREASRCARKAPLRTSRSRCASTPAMRSCASAIASRSRAAGPSRSRSRVGAAPQSSRSTRASW
jgi:AsmA protein